MCIRDSADPEAGSHVAGGDAGLADRVLGRRRAEAAGLGVGKEQTFNYHSRGAFVNLGRHKAVASGPGLTLSGFPAWWAARTYHVTQMPGVARKLHAVADWTVGLPFGRDTAEVGSIGHPHPLKAEVYEKGGTHRPVG